MKASTMTINSSAMTVSTPSPAPRYTKQDVPPKVQPAGGVVRGGVVRGGAVEGVAVILTLHGNTGSFNRTVCHGCC